MPIKRNSIFNYNPATLFPLTIYADACRVSSDDEKGGPSTTAMTTTTEYHMSDALLHHFSALGAVKVGEPMRTHTTFRTGGPADVLLCPRDAAATAEAVRIAVDNSIPLTVIGGGSNLLVGDRGIRGLTIRCAYDGPAGEGLRLETDGAVYADAFVKKSEFIQFCIDRGLEGMEFMAGIPGCLGGGIVMNAGTTLGNFSDIVRRVVYVDTAGTIREMPVTKDMAGYRRLEIGGNPIITGAYFALKESADTGAVRGRIRGILQERSAKHPLDYPSAGSVFKNPDGHSSWKLINDAGLRGCRIGGAMVSELHTNFIINFDNATSKDILNCIEHVRERVLARFGLVLEPEIRVIGEI